MATTLERTDQGKMADLSLPPEEHGGDDGKVTSAVMGSGAGGGHVLNCPPPSVRPLPMGKLQVK